MCMDGLLKRMLLLAGMLLVCCALVVWGLLRRCALEGELTIGVRKAEGELEAHAWVELDGVSLEQGHETVPFAPLRAWSGMSGQGTTL